MASIHTQDLVTDFCQLKDINDNLLFVRSSKTFFFYEEHEGYYRHVSEDDLRQMVYEFSKDKGKSIGKSFLNDFLHVLELQCYKKIQDLPKEYIALTDTLLNMTTFESEPFDKKKYAHFRINCSSAQLTNGCSRFQQFLQEVLVKDDQTPDEELLSLIQEMAGFYLMPDMKPHVMFFLVGSGMNGKSVFINLMTELIGREFISALSLQTITTQRFALTGIIGKRINICNEEESKYMKGDKFKALVTGDAVEGERKFGGTFTLYPSTKLLFATNNIPLFERIDQAIKRRVMIIPFKRTFTEQERDYHLTEKLLQELPGIAGWAIEGAKRLVNNGYRFTKSAAIEIAMKDFENAISSAAMFIREKFTPHTSNTFFIPNEDLYIEYTTWCQINGRKPLNSTNFHKEITRISGQESVLGWNKELKKTCRGRNLKPYDESGSQPIEGEPTALEAVSL